MKFFIDTAEVKEIREAAAMGLVDGVTTNPSLVAKSGRKFRDVLLEICDIVKGPVSAEVVSTNYDGMMKEARELAALRHEHRRQDPADPRGPQGGPHVRRRGHQDQRHAVLLGDPGAARREGRRVVHLAVRRPPRRRLDRRHAADRRDPRRSTTTTASTTEVLVASVRHPMHVQQAALMGAHVATCPLSVLLQLAQAPADRPRPREVPRRLGESPEVRSRCASRVGLVRRRSGRATTVARGWTRRADGRAARVDGHAHRRADVRGRLCDTRPARSSSALRSLAGDRSCRSSRSPTRARRSRSRPLAPTGPTSIVVTVNDSSSNALDFEVLP